MYKKYCVLEAAGRVGRAVVDEILKANKLDSRLGRFIASQVTDEAWVCETLYIAEKKG